MKIPSIIRKTVGKPDEWRRKDLRFYIPISKIKFSFQFSMSSHVFFYALLCFSIQKIFFNFKCFIMVYYAFQWFVMLNK